MQQLSVIDSMFLQDSPRTPNHMCMVAIYDPSTSPNPAPTFDEIVAKLSASLPAAPSFRRKLVRVPFGLDRPYWVEDPDFDLEFHVRHIALPKPGDWRQLCVQVGRLHSRPIDITRPPWEMTVIDGLDQIGMFPPGCFATVLKVHHSAIDGISGVELLTAIHDLEPDPPRSQEPDPWQPEPIPSARSLLARAGMHAFTNPVGTVRLIASSGRPLTREMAAKARHREPAQRIPRTRLNQRVSAHRVFDEARCSLQDLKVIKAAVLGATINDVCLSIIGGALRAYLDSFGELPDEPMVTMVPVSTRLPDDRSVGGNQISAMRVSMHTDIADPLARLAAIQQTTSVKKEAQDGVAIPVLLEVARVVPGSLIGAAMLAMSALGSRAPVLANTIVTNVPGSPVPLYFLGARMVRSTGCVPLVDGIGLFHCVSSYCGEFVFMITADRDLMPDTAPYVAHVNASIAEHLAAAAALAALATAMEPTPATRRTRASPSTRRRSS